MTHIPSGAAQLPIIVSRADHTISRAHISPNALRVLYKLKDGGFQAFLVGGAVRDLLLGRRPKDFDIATNAHPEQVRQLFRNCRLIGRRFHLAHVRFGMDVVEVATFRAAHTEIDEDNSVDEGGHRVLDSSGRILRDNLYGTIEEDVWRRDFTANALYYSIADFSVWDYVGGVRDANDRVLRLIGDPHTRYREDPVRMLRAVRFAAKLGFQLHPQTAAPIRELARMLDAVPPARLFDEVNKMFLSGSGLRALELLIEFQLLEHLFPSLAAVGADDPESAAGKLLRLGLDSTDQRVNLDKPVTPMFLYAVLLWPAIVRTVEQHRNASMNESQALQVACDHVVLQQQAHVSVPRRFTAPLRELIGLQARFERRDGRRSLRLLAHPRFRAAYDFLLLRAAAGEVAQELADWWTEVQTLPPEQQLERAAQVAVAAPAATPGKRRRRRRRKSGSPAQ